MKTMKNTSIQTKITETCPYCKLKEIKRYARKHGRCVSILDSPMKGKDIFSHPPEVRRSIIKLHLSVFREKTVYYDYFHRLWVSEIPKSCTCGKGG